MNDTHTTTGGCPAVAMFSLLSKRHMLLILYTLTRGSKGFNELEEGIEVNTATLAKRLRELEGASLIERVVCEKDKRNRYYGLTKKGKDVSTLIENLGDIARRK